MTDSPESGVPVTRPKPGTFASALRHREFRKLIISYSLSATGQTFGTVAITVAIFARTHSAIWVAAAAAGRLLPYVMFSALSGALADRVDRRRVFAITAVMRAALVIAAGAAVAHGAPAIVIVLLAFLFTACGTPCYPALAAAVPSVVPADDLAPANGLFTAIETLSFVVGPAVGGAVLIFASPAIALVVNGAIFIAALPALRGLRPAQRPASGSDASDEADDDAPSLLRAVVSGARAIAFSGGVTAPLLLVVTVNLVYGGSLVGLVLVAERLLHTGQSGFGVLNAGLGVGAFAGVTLTNRLARTRRPLVTMAWTTLLAGIPFALLALTGSPVVGVALMVCSEVGSISTEVLAITLVQRALPRAVIGSVFGILDALVVGAILVGSITAPLLIHLVGLRGSLIVVGAIVPISAAVVAIRLPAADRGGLDDSTPLAERIAVLRQVGWLVNVLEPAVEALAATADEEFVERGAVVVRQGDAPDDFFVSMSGRLEVRQTTTDGAGERVLATLTPVSGFGEIGLLQGVPRTASVVAIEPCRLLRVNGERFIAAVSAVPASAAGAPGGGLLGRLGAGAAESTTRTRRRSKA